LHFLGIPQLNLGDTPITTDRRKAVALLAYLAVSGGKHTREFLSGFFWPDFDQAKAFSNLRRTIWEVHQVLGENWLIADRDSVWLNPETEIDLDVARFRDLLSQCHQQSDPAARIPLLVEAEKLYHNHFLTGFSLKDAFPFNEWAYAESEELRGQLAEALTVLSEDYCTLGQAVKAIPFARRLISLDPLNESAHRQLMEVYLQAGQHNAALKQYQTCEQILRKELNLDPQPETRALYKKIRKREMKPVRVEEKVETSEPKHNLPLQLSSFIGREKEIDDIANLLARNRLVTLAGVGGIGKTRLSLQVGQRLLNEYPNGVWFIALDSLADPALVPQNVAAIFEIREGSERPIIETLKHILRQKTALLILDNCEHLLEGCAQLINALLTSCPNLKVLATSRETLNIAGEAIYYMPALSLPEQVNTSLEALAEYEAVKLFVERALLAFSSFTLTKENAQTIANICRRVDGIPLAIELAAARVNFLQVEEILKQLQDSFSLLASDGRSALHRHQTLQASMDWSWGLLTETEQIFLRKLSVFAGGWTIESAQAVCEGNTLNLISALVKKSLIVVDQETGSETRYCFHEIIRQYMRERLMESGEEENIRVRHLQYFLQLSEQAEPALRGPSQTEWYARLNNERDNIRAALEWAYKTDLEAGLYTCGRLGQFWEEYDLREGERWLSKFLETDESHIYPHGRAKALYAYGIILHSTQQYSLLEKVAEECLTLFRESGDRSGEIDGLISVANSKYASNNSTVLVTEITQQALNLSESIGDTWRKAFVLAELGSLGIGFENQAPYWNKAIVLFREVRDLRLLEDCLGILGTLEVLNGNFESAQKKLDEAIRLRQALKRKGSMSFILNGLSRIEDIKGNFEKAKLLLEEDMAAAKDLGHHMKYFWDRTLLGHVIVHQGKIIEARDIFYETMQEFFNVKEEMGVVFALEGTASIYVRVGKPEHAARLIGWADVTREKLGDKRPLIEQADVDKVIAACIIKMGEAAFSDAYDEGQKMTLDEAVAYALEEHR
jgi:predicted ATPase/DNA-binding SARP family transcriptional activator